MNYVAVICLIFVVLWVALCIWALHATELRNRR
jgi:hypothetical protein